MRATALYSAVGEQLTHYSLDALGARLVRRSSVSLPAKVQYAWPHPSGRTLYVASSDGRQSGGSQHYLNAVDIDASGALRLSQPPTVLRARPIHVSVDAAGAFALIAYNVPSAVTVHRLDAEGAVEGEVSQSQPLDCGTYAHQVRALPSNRAVVLCARGNDGSWWRKEEPGALKVFGFEKGRLTNRSTIAPGAGYGFGPRHLDFHPQRPWIYVALERQNQLQMFEAGDDEVAAEPSFTVSTLRDARPSRDQWAGAVHVHPNGRFVYVSNRARSATWWRRCGENTIAVFALDPRTGEPRWIQSVDTLSCHVRTFFIHPAGAMMIAGSIAPGRVCQSGRRIEVPARITVFGVRDDGCLELAQLHDLPARSDKQLWIGSIS